jgi:hypothetical protein
MFRTLQESLETRSKTIQRMVPVKDEVRRLTQEFIVHQYPKMIRGLTVLYNEEERLLSITTPHKGLAQELSLNTKDIRAHLATHRFRVRSIIVR